MSEHGAIIDFGDTVRIERRFKQERDGRIVWDVYQLRAVKNGVHPVHRSKTTESHVWVPVGSGSEDEARTLAGELAG